MPRRVLVTRPAPEAARTAARLAELGFEPIALPLTETVALPVDAASLRDPIDAVAVTSANALRHASAGLIARLAGKPCFAVGAKTARRAEALGFSVVEQGTGDAGGLADLVIRRLSASARIAYPCGRVRLSSFEARLEQAGIGVEIVETYDTRAVDYGPGELSATIGAEPVDAVLLYSSKAAERFARLDWPEPALGLLARAAYLCLSPRVAAQLSGVRASQALVAREPTEAALLRLLEQA